MRPARLCLVFALVAAACAAKPTHSEPPASAPSPLHDKPAPNFRRPALSGADVDTEAMRGKVIVVKFFARYCEPCKKTLPAAEKLAQKHAEVAFVGVSEDERESHTKELVSTYGLTFPVVMDRGNVLAGRFRVSEIPVTFVIDGDGVVRWVGGPGQADGDLARALDVLTR